MNLIHIEVYYYSAYIVICSEQFQEREQAYFRWFWRELFAQQKSVLLKPNKISIFTIGLEL